MVPTAAAETISGTIPESIPIEASYTFEPPSFDGIGKTYLGREIAEVMGYEGARWLDRPSRAQEERPEALVKAIALPSTATVADIGAGTGYLTFRLAEQLPEGKVYAVDRQPEMLALLQATIDRDQVTNVVPVQGTEVSPELAPDSIDLALMVDVYHELNYPREMLGAIAQALKPNGRLVLAEYKAENPLVMIKPHHKMSRSQVVAELSANGFELKASPRVLPQQHLLIFGKQRG